MDIMFENYDRKIEKINAALNANGIANLEEAYEICKSNGLDPYQTARKQKQSVSSLKSIAARLPCPRPTFLSSATDPGRQNA